MIKNIKRFAAALFILFFAILFLSCSFIQENKTGRVSFSTDNLIQNLSRAAIPLNDSDFLEVTLLGDYTSTKTSNLKQGNKIIFEEVPINANIYAEVYIYNINALNKRNDKYFGKSDSITVNDGDNLLTVLLKSLQQEEETASYTVQHFIQNIDDDDYTEVKNDREELEGINLELTKAEAETYTGFIAKTVNQETIKADGSTVIKIYYDREIHTVSYDSGVSDESISLPSDQKFRYGATVEIDFTTSIIRTGYTFQSWTNKSTGDIFTSGNSTSFVMGTSDVILTAQWTPSSNTKYTVRHLQQNIYDNDYTLVETETLEGTSLELTKAESKTYTGFTVAYAIGQKPIAEDGSTVIEIKYDRKTACLYYQDGVENDTIAVPVDETIYRYGAEIKIDFANIGKRTGHTFSGWKDTTNDNLYSQSETSKLIIGAEDLTLYAQWKANTYSITYDLNNGSWADGFTAATSYTYGERQNLPGADKITREGYGLSGWYTENGTLLTEIPSDMTGDIKLLAQWTAGATTYTVHHWKQNIFDDEYTEVKEDAQVQTGISETDSNAKANSYEGFIVKDFEQHKISSDGSTVINIYYDRITASLIFDDGVEEESISVPESQKYRYGSSVEINVTPTLTRPGYDFTGWQAADGTIYKLGGTTYITMRTTDITLTAQWTPSSNTKYSVIHLLQNIDDDDYTKYDSETLTGTSLEQTVAKAKTYTGFVSKTVNQQAIKADGTTVIEIYYDRETHTVTYDSGISDETIAVPSVKEYRYGAIVKIDFTANMKRTGYNFAGWKTKTGTIYTPDGVSSFEFEMGTSDILLTAQWIVTSNIKYTVRHLQQNINDDDYTEIETELLMGSSFEKTNAEAKIYTGFITPSVTQATINPDETTIVEIKYDRKTARIYYKDGVDNSIEVPADAIYRYGAKVKLDFTNIGKRTGYTFSHWEDTANDSDFVLGESEELTIGTDDITLYAQWIANVYNITFDLNKGSWADGYIAPTTYIYGQHLNLPGSDKVTRTGYGLSGWYTETGSLLTEIPSNMTGDIKLIAQWTAGATNYTVRHWQQNIEDDEYTAVKEDEQILTGISDDTTGAKANTYTGFTSKTVTQKTIAADGSTVIDIYYDRNTYTLSYDDGLSDETISVPSAKEYRYGSVIKIESQDSERTGYDFAGWKDSSGTVYEAGSTLQIADFNISLTAQWTPAEGIKYTVKHLQQNIDDEDYTSYETETLTGKTLDLTEALAKSYTGFTAQPISQKAIAADGTTVVEVKYDRNKYLLNYADNIVSEEIDVPSSRQYPYGKTVTLDFTNIGKRTGYTFSGWKDTVSGKLYSPDDANSLVIGTEAVSLYAQWTANTYYINYDLNSGSWADGFTAATSYTYGKRQNLPGADKVVRAGYGLSGWYTENGTLLTEISASMTGDIKLIAQWTAGATNYTVRHWQQNIEDDEYTAVKEDEQVLTGISDDTTGAKANTYTGFTSKTVTQKTIAADGSTVIDIYYDRNTYTLSYDDGLSDETITVPSAKEYRYGSVINIESQDSERTGYDFAGWKDSSGTVYEAGSTLQIADFNISLTAQWTPAEGIKYTVKHLQQNIDDEDYTSYETETLTGKTLDLTEALAKSYTGFTAQPVSQKTIAADGTTVVEVKYDRNSYKVSFNSAGGSTVAVQTVRYEAKANEPESPTKAGNAFLGWYTSSDGGSTLSAETFDFKTQITGDITLYAKWSGAAVTITITEPDDKSVEISCGTLNDPTAKELHFYIENYDSSANYKWYLDDVEITDSTPGFYIGGNTLTLYKDGYAAGVYVITLSSGAYSSSVIVEITGN